MADIFHEIRFRTEGDPAKWESTCLPIGNGYMGATFFGGVSQERIVLNEKTLWIGGPSAGRPDYNGGNRKGAYKAVKKVQELLAEGQYDEALSLLPELTCETGDGFGAYQCLCDAVLDFPGLDKAGLSDYERVLNLYSGDYDNIFTCGGVRYFRHAFASYPARVICVHFECDEPDRISFTLSLDKLHEGADVKAEGNRLDYSGALADNGLRYHAAFYIKNTGGAVECGDGRISVKNADEGKLFIGKHMDLAILAVYDGYRFAPVSLSCKDPLSEVIVNCTLCNAHLFKLDCDSLFSLLNSHAVKLF